MTLNEILQIFWGFLGTLGFAILFNVRGKRLVFTGLGGLIAWGLFIILSKLIPNKPLNYFIVALLISIYAEVMARVLKTPTTGFVTLSLIPLIPGGSLYYTMAYAFQSDFARFLDKAIYTLQLASALALGIIIASAFIRIFLKILKKI